MKVIFYAVYTKQWHSYYSIAWEVDLQFWQETSSKVYLPQPVPLDHAIKACSFLNHPSRTNLSFFIRFQQIASSLGLSSALLEMPSPARDPLQWNLLLQAAIKVCSLFTGRALLREEAMGYLQEKLLLSVSACASLQLAALLNLVKFKPAVGPLWEKQNLAQSFFRQLFFSRARTNRNLICQRCGSSGDKLVYSPCAACGKPCAYCTECLLLGRSRECELLVLVPDENTASQQKMKNKQELPSQAQLRECWDLSVPQSEATHQALSFLFPTFKNAALLPFRKKKGERRNLSQVWRRPNKSFFSTFLIWAVTGAGKTEMIFPFDGDPVLSFAVDKCCKYEGKKIYLTATPSLKMQQQVSRHHLACARVPVRFHGFPLPEPNQLKIPEIKKILSAKKIPKKLLYYLRYSLARGAQIFVFVPFIKYIAPLISIFQEHSSLLSIPKERIGGTSSQDKWRAAKVQAFRERTLRLLITTTILERGVTVPKSDVYVLDADNSLFKCSALVQMAGRSGRSGTDPQGYVFFAASAWTSSQRQAKREIQTMNKIARKKGFLI